MRYINIMHRVFAITMVAAFVVCLLVVCVLIYQAFAVTTTPMERDWEALKLVVEALKYAFLTGVGAFVLAAITSTYIEHR